MSNVTISTLIDEMNDVVERYSSQHDQARATAERLERLIAKGPNLDETLTAGCTEHYARYKVYKHPSDRFCIVAMVWGPGQGTALHDHDGVWCVEGVCRGCMHITRFELEAEEGDLLTFTKAAELVAGVGAVGNLIPPSEYHVMENRGEQPAVSLHVYGHELKKIRRYIPIEDGVHYQRHEVSLSYDNGG